jgi:hypothetical protein
VPYLLKFAVKFLLPLHVETPDSRNVISILHFCTMGLITRATYKSSMNQQDVSGGLPCLPWSIFGCGMGLGRRMECLEATRSLPLARHWISVHSGYPMRTSKTVHSLPFYLVTCVRLASSKKLVKYIRKATCREPNNSRSARINRVSFIKKGNSRNLYCQLSLLLVNRQPDSLLECVW